VAGFTINATDALRLMAELQAAHSVLVSEVRRDTLASGRTIQQMARSLARSKSMPGLAGSIYTKTRQTVSGIEVTVEAKSPFGLIREFGAGRSGPHPFMLPAMMAELPVWEQKMADATSRALR
jgi:hypothetical protein